MSILIATHCKVAKRHPKAKTIHLRKQITQSRKVLEPSWNIQRDGAIGPSLVNSEQWIGRALKQCQQASCTCLLGCPRTAVAVESRYVNAVHTWRLSTHRLPTVGPPSVHDYTFHWWLFVGICLTCIVHVNMLRIPIRTNNGANALARTSCQPHHPGLTRRSCCAG